MRTGSNGSGTARDARQAARRELATSDGRHHAAPVLHGQAASQKEAAAAEQRRNVMAMAAERRIAERRNADSPEESQLPSQQNKPETTGPPRPPAAVAGATQWRTGRTIPTQRGSAHAGDGRERVAARLSGLPFRQLTLLAGGTTGADQSAARDVGSQHEHAGAPGRGSVDNAEARLAAVEAKYRRRRAQLIVSSRPAAVRRLLAADEVH